MSKQKAVINHDGWTNLMTLVGTNKDRVVGTSFSKDRILSREELESIYRANGLGRKIIDTFPGDGTRKWITVEGDTEGEILSVFNKLKVKKVMREAWTLSDLYGGSIVVIGADDGGTFEQPLSEENIRNIDFLRVYDRHQVTWTSFDLEDDPTVEGFGLPAFYNISPYTTGGTYRVHASRVIRFDGAFVPERVRQRNNGWGDSKLQAVYSELKNVGATFNGAANIIEDFVQTVLSIENLQDMIANGQEDLVMKRLSILDMSRSVLNTLLLDANEKYSKEASSVAGLPDLLDRFMIILSAVTRIPVTKLFGRSPSGLNATGDADLSNYNDDVSDDQQEILHDPLTRIMNLVVASRDGPFKGKMPKDELRVKFIPLEQLSEKEIAETRKLNMETDTGYVNAGVLDPTEVAVSRFGGSEYSAETIIDKKFRTPDGSLDEPPVDDNALPVDPNAPPVDNKEPAPTE